MTRTAPCRRMILHFSHILLTELRTFTGLTPCFLPFRAAAPPHCPLWLPILLHAAAHASGGRVRLYL